MKSLPLSLSFALFAFACLAPLAKTADGSLIVFPDNGWTAGTPAPGQTVNQTFTTTGPNVTVSVNNNGSSASGASWTAGYPALNSTQTTGGFSGQVGLQLFASGTSSTSAYILTTVTFASPVTNVSFQIWDVDKSAGQFIDAISSIQALSDTGMVQAASSVSSAVAGYNTITGSGLTYLVSGTAAASNSTNQGTIDISFSGPITQFSFKWGNSDAGLGQQAIGLGNINFTVVPEANPLWPIVGLLAAVGAKRVLRPPKSGRED